MTATVVVTPYPELGEGARVVTVSCRHGVRRIGFNTEATLPDEAFGALGRAAVHAETHCRCTKAPCLVHRRG